METTWRYMLAQKILLRLNQIGSNWKTNECDWEVICTRFCKENLQRNGYAGKWKSIIARNQ